MGCPVLKKEEEMGTLCFPTAAAVPERHTC